MIHERSRLTPNIVAMAERRRDATHPVISVIDANLNKIIPLSKLYEDIVGGKEQQEFIREHYGFLADAIIEAAPFTLEPTDLITIWSIAQEVFSKNHRNSLATIITSAYAIQGLESPEWKELPRHLLETGTFPDVVSHESSGLLHISKKVDEITESLNELNFYVYGNKDHAFKTRGRLVQRKKVSETEVEELDKLRAHHELHSTPTLNEIREDFDHGLHWTFRLDYALRLAGLLDKKIPLTDLGADRT